MVCPEYVEASSRRGRKERQDQGHLTQRRQDAERTQTRDTSHRGGREPFVIPARRRGHCVAADATDPACPSARICRRRRQIRVYRGPGIGFTMIAQTTPLRLPWRRLDRPTPHDSLPPSLLTELRRTGRRAGGPGSRRDDRRASYPCFSIRPTRSVRIWVVECVTDYPTIDSLPLAGFLPLARGEFAAERRSL